MKVVVSTNCQTNGITSALRLMLPDMVIVPIQIPLIEDLKKTEELVNILKMSDVWVTNSRFDLAKGLPIEIIKVPAIFFESFHPDITYVKHRITTEFIQPHYNSQIGVWAYSNNIKIKDAAKLYNSYTYKALGYLDCWRNSVEELKKIFLENDISAEDFFSFFNRIKKYGVFMHTTNHPRHEVISELSKIIARRLNAPPVLVNREIIIPDYLTFSSWPLYPEIAEELGHAGQYIWRFNYCEIDGVENFLAYTYKKFEEQNLHPKSLVMLKEQDNLDLILSSQL